jgi:SAM-dependent methyltransferase
MAATYNWHIYGEVWAQEWRRTDRTLAPVNQALVAAALAAAGAQAPRKILDIGCGAGTTSFALADALPEARITGVDLSPALVAVAWERAEGRTGLRFELGDAARWTPHDTGFDLIVSRHGVMFFDDPVAAFAHVHALARPAAALAFSCFRGRDENEWVRAMRPIFACFAPETLTGPEPPVGPFAFADPARIETILHAAGFADPQVAPLDFDYVAGEGEDPIADALGFFGRIGPLATMLRTLDEPAKEEATGMLAEIVAAHEADGRVAFGAAAWIVTSARP